MFKICLFLCLSLLLASHAVAQVAPAMQAPRFNLQVGGEFSIFKPDFGAQSLLGIGAYADLDLPRWIGVEAEARTLSFNKYQNKLRMDSGSGGARFFFPYHQRLVPYAKGLIGFGSIDFPFHGPYDHDTMLLYTIGGGADYKLSHRISIRGEYEYQFWPDFLGKGLSPHGVNIGASYRIF
jgi:opacity protein-like surface antigen